MAEKPVLYVDVLAQQCSIIYGSDKPERIDDYIINSAKRIHSLIIWDASQNAFFEAVALPPKISNENARYHIQFGASRRLEMIWYAYRNLATMAPPDRLVPLASDESRQLMVDINIIYLNIRGTLDNLAWALLHEFDPNRIQSMPASQVSLFLPGIRANPKFASLAAIVNQHDAWDRDVKDRRDPAAHRIPLALPPAVLGPGDASRYRELEAEYSAAIRGHEFERADQILDAQRKLGKFQPWFVHEPAVGPIEIYPTVPDDLCHLVQLFEAVHSFFLLITCIKREVVRRGPIR